MRGTAEFEKDSSNHPLATAHSDDEACLIHVPEIVILIVIFSIPLNDYKNQLRTKMPYCVLALLKSLKYCIIVWGSVATTLVASLLF